MGDYLTFRKMITPVIIQVIFWLGVAGAVIAGFAAMGQAGFFAGLLILVLGPIAVRIWCELLIVMFRMHESLEAIRNK